MSRLLCIGDVHYRASKPCGRLDDYAETLWGKVVQIIDIAYDYDCDYIVQPGDLFDSATPTMQVLMRAIWYQLGNHLNGDKIPWFGVAGQHDQRYHGNALENTPLAVLQAAGALCLLTGDKPYVHQKLALYGCGWGEEIPRPKPQVIGTANVLVMHRMVVDEKLWKAQQDFEWGQHILRRNPKFNLIVTGDNHHFFIEKYGKQLLVNCGSLMRTNIDQFDHEPSVVVYDTKTCGHTVVPLHVAPAVDVFDLQQAEEVKERNALLESFIEQVGDSRTDPGLDFLANLEHLTRAKGVPTGVVKCVSKILEVSNAGN